MEKWEEIVMCIVIDRESRNTFVRYLKACTKGEMEWNQTVAVPNLRIAARRSGQADKLGGITYEDKWLAAQELRNQLAEIVSYELDKGMSWDDRTLLIQEIIEHTENALSHFCALKNSLSESKETEMTTNTKPFETINYVYGNDVSKMSEEDLLNAIRKAEKDLAEYDNIKTLSKKVEQRKAEIQEAISKMVEILDAE